MIGTVFLTVAQILRLHENTIRDHGGRAELRDEPLFLSAVAQPEATFGGNYLHEDLFHMAAAYFFHLSQNQAFSDGNKRVGLLAMFAFLEINGYELTVPDEQLYPKLLEVSEGYCNKEELAIFVRANTQPKHE